MTTVGHAHRIINAGIRALGYLREVDPIRFDPAFESSDSEFEVDTQTPEYIEALNHYRAALAFHNALSRRVITFYQNFQELIDEKSDVPIGILRDCARCSEDSLVIDDASGERFDADEGVVVVPMLGQPPMALCSYCEHLFHKDD